MTELEMVNAIFHVLRAGCAWRPLPDRFPPRRTVCRWFARLRHGGVLEAPNHHLVILDRERTEREASPTVAVIYSQSTRTAEAGGPRGQDAGKKVMGRKRHAMVDTDGRALVLHFHPGSVQDRHGAPPLLRASQCRWPFVGVEILRKPKGRVGFAIHARQWVAERCFVWISATAASPTTPRPSSLLPRPSSTPPRPLHMRFGTGSEVRSVGPN